MPWGNSFCGVWIKSFLSCQVKQWDRKIRRRLSNELQSPGCNLRCACLDFKKEAKGATP
ncbi:hypothetical protein BRADI_3g39627v3 [Brachypodium distachyon]|uniref:Uncharacterized protein n=1 Tax=Brachypodium distachyon TaxID=15368 RepID=A0A2K2D273_BRADI|nr:hypothetical protein BRADI_3g39627v3 [Brachypodium distachyon]